MAVVTTITRPAELEESAAPIRVSDDCAMLEEDLESVSITVETLDREPAEIRFSELRGLYGSSGSSSPIGERLRVSVIAVSADPSSEYAAPVSERISEIIGAAELRIIGQWESAAGAAAELLESGSDLTFRISE